MEQLWVDQYRPKSIASLDYNRQLSNQLSELAKSEIFPHLLFYGPNGAGKKTRVMAFLKEVFGSGVYQVTQEEREFQVNETSSNKVQCSLLTSKYHLDVTPSDCDNQDRVIVQKLIKEVASTHQVNVKHQHDFKVIILNEVDNLTHEAQASLRRTMEKYIERCRLILVCEQLSKVIDPIRSRCLLLRCPAPTNNEIIGILKNVADIEKMNLSEIFAQKLAQSSEGNLREAILALQAAKIEHGNNMRNDQKIQTQEWKEFIARNIADKLVKTQTPETLKDIRDRFYELIVNCIPPDRIIKTLLDILLQITNVKIHPELILNAADCDNKLKQGQNSIFHLESFAARCMVTVMKQ